MGGVGKEAGMKETKGDIKLGITSTTNRISQNLFYSFLHVVL